MLQRICVHSKEGGGDTQMPPCLSACVSGDLGLLSGSRGVNRKGWSPSDHFLCQNTQARLRSPVRQRHRLMEQGEASTARAAARRGGWCVDIVIFNTQYSERREATCGVTWTFAGVFFILVKNSSTTTSKLTESPLGLSKKEKSPKSLWAVLIK